MPFSLSIRNIAVAIMLAATVLGAGCARQQKDLEAGMGAGVATPGSAQDFQVNVGDRVFFETDSSALTPQSMATLDRQAQWLNQYPRYSFTLEGHADERGTREYNLALGAAAPRLSATTWWPAAFPPSGCARSPTARNGPSPSATTFPAGRRTAAR